MVLRYVHKLFHTTLFKRWSLIPVFLNVGKTWLLTSHKSAAPDGARDSSAHCEHPGARQVGVGVMRGPCATVLGSG